METILKRDVSCKECADVMASVRVDFVNFSANLCEAQVKATCSDSIFPHTDFEETWTSDYDKPVL